MRAKSLKIVTGISLILVLIILYLYNRKPPADTEPVKVEPSSLLYDTKVVHVPQLDIDITAKGHRKASDFVVPELSYKVYKITNKWTYEESVFNPLRSKRPTAKVDVDPVRYIENLTLSTSKSCDFCSYEEHTAADVFGRIENPFSASSSNTFKLAKFHGLFFSKSHHPLKLNYSVLAEIFINTSRQWFQKANENDRKQIYPTVLWDSLPHAGASQVHPHVHGLLGEYQYAGLMESMHSVAERYYETHKRSYWTDIVLIHWALGLAIHTYETVLIVPLNPRKDHEYMIISPSVNDDAAKLLYRIIESYKNNLKVYCWSGGGAYPVMDDSKSGLPMIYRIGSRGVCTSVGSDVSSLELYTINNINTDLQKTFMSVLNTTVF